MSSVIEIIEKDVDFFCDDLRESLLRYLREKLPVCIEQKHDVESADGLLEQYTGGLTGFRWIGGTVSVHYGRPASTVLLRRDS